MTDREMLELAAKAAGIRLEWDGPPADWVPMFYEGKTYYVWDQIKEFGDALRLAVRLGLTVCNEHESAGVVYCTRGETEEFPTVAAGKVGDPPGITEADYLATCFAIVLAAAEIGKKMP